MLPGDEVLVERRYWVRVWIVMRALLSGWAESGNSFLNARDSAVEFVKDLWILLLILLLPLTFWAAPLWLWLLESDDRKRKAAREKARTEMFADRRSTHQGEQP